MFERSERLFPLVLLAALACSGSAPEPAAGGSFAQQVSVSVDPKEAILPPGAQLSLAAGVTGNADEFVVWEVVEGHAGGTVDVSGLYTAPAVPGTYHVVAVARADATKSATATLTVAADAPTLPVAVAITPGAGAVYGCQSLALSAQVGNSPNKEVTWSIEEGAAGGAVSATGVYTAPVVPGTYHVTATSAADPSRTAVAAITVTTKVLGVAVNPPSPAVKAGETVQFTATVTTTCGVFSTSNTAS